MAANGHRFAVLVDGELRARFSDRTEPIPLSQADGEVEIVDDDSGEQLAAIPLFEPEDVLDGPWTGTADVPSGGYLTYQIGAERDPLRLVLTVRHDRPVSLPSAPVVPPAPTFQLPSPDRRRSSYGRWLTAACVVLALSLSAYGFRNRQQLLGTISTLSADLGFNKPFDLKFAAVGQRVLQLDLSVDRNAIAEVFIDWDDPSSPDPAPHGTRIFPSAELKDYGRNARVVLRHEYPAVGEEGRLARARARIVPLPLPDPRPETLADHRLRPSQRILITNDGLLLNPPESRIRVTSPEDRAIVPARTELTLEMVALKAPIHVFGVEAQDPLTYRYLRSIAPPVGRQTTTESHVVDTTRLGANGPFTLVLVSTNLVELSPDQELPWEDVPRNAPRGAIQLSHAGVILEPLPNSAITGIDTLRAVSFVRGQHASVVVRPVRDGRFWVQNAPLPAPEGTEFRVAVQYGGRDEYEVWVALTEDPTLLGVGAVLEDRPLVDAAGRPVYWLGPVFVHME